MDAGIPCERGVSVVYAVIYVDWESQPVDGIYSSHALAVAEVQRLHKGTHAFIPSENNRLPCGYRDASGLPCYYEIEAYTLDGPLP